ncbi:hypothetical protein Cantr_07273 [Candida viswanathii]|uniref:Uncharacterized protein n=1 Tax=Candida viswanathii TaxID=5486 RepID=A0A367Y1Q8_9ASCO|nr:hypothetical protein Cantr_07273 [Candida viswanathii]
MAGQLLVDTVQVFLEKNPFIPQWVKWKVILRVLRIKNSTSWANFIVLNKPIKEALIGIAKPTDPDSKRRLEKLGNFISCVFLYAATVNSKLIPKDYLLIYLILNYIGELDPPSNSKIVVSPKTSKYSKIQHYKPWLQELYKKKEYIIFPAVFAQILSNYLTPTKYKLNQKYLSSSLKRYVLNPIWINYKLGINYNRVSWIGLLRVYLFQNFVLLGFIGLYYFKSKLLDKLYEVKHNGNETKNYNDVIKDYLCSVYHRSNSFVNLIFGCNLASILLISLTSPIFRVLTPSSTTKMSWIQLLYVDHLKLFFKSYTKIIGFIAGFITLYLNSLNLIPSWGCKENVRHIDSQFIDALNLYLFRLILLSKWRITKYNHPWFARYSKLDWNRLETVLMSFGIWQIMNLNDFLKTHKDDKLSKNSMIKLVNYVM